MVPPDAVLEIPTSSYRSGKSEDNQNSGLCVGETHPKAPVDSGHFSPFASFTIPFTVSIFNTVTPVGRAVPLRGGGGSELAEYSVEGTATQCTCCAAVQDQENPDFRDANFIPKSSQKIENRRKKRKKKSTTEHLKRKDIFKKGVKRFFLRKGGIFFFAVIRVKEGGG